MRADLSYEDIRISGLGSEEMLFNSSSPKEAETKRKILHHLHSNGLREEGLMRLAGFVEKVQILKAEIERSYVMSPTLVENLIRQSSAHDVSVLLKQLVRHLPEPLLTNSHMDCFLQVPSNN
ncbi:rho GTPase-activating protein 18 [Caerostris darwini]|uniref:Rho GTPase-activating protein 18 n=1 Tax=Caerostris darwini TaxID=1538125 RepID=A0AAV4R102_9ARAC|nr:rho GTPase-activating protein 18 [Caerostris darwini]